MHEFLRIEQLREQERVRHAINQIAKKTKTIEKGGEVSFQINARSFINRERHLVLASIQKPFLDNA